MRILITGVNGFIGQHLANALIKNGHIVIGIGRDKKPKIKQINDYHKGTILDKKIIERVSQDVEVIVHLAALTSHKDIVERKFETLETNFLGTKNVLEIFLNSKTAKKFLFPSTGKVYGKILNLPISEDHPTNPKNLLGKSKLITEKLIDFYSNDQKEFTIFRVFNLYGSMQNNNFLIPTILAQLTLGKKEIVLGDVEARRDYVYIDDLVEAFVLAIEKKGKLGISIYNICTGIGLSAVQIVGIISKIKKINIKIKTNPVLLRNDEMRQEYGSFKQAEKNLSWKPRVSIEEGLRKLLIK